MDIQSLQSELEAELENPQNAERPPEKHRKLPSWIIILLLVISYPIGLLIMWIFSAWSKKVKLAITLTPVLLVIGLWLSLISSLDRSRDEIKESLNSQTYRSEEYGFEFRYPLDWRLVEDKEFWGLGPVSIQEDTLFTIFITLNIPVVGKDSNPNHEITKIEDVVFNNLPAKLVYDKNLTANEVSTRLYLVHDSLIISLGQPTLNNSDYPFDHGYNQMITQILSTFKFIEPEFCIQVITPARNPVTGEVRDFPTPCDVPEGWEKI